MMSDMGGMDAMIKKCKGICKTMSVEEKADCVSKMMPNCLDSVLEALDEKGAHKLARQMKEKINTIVEKYLYPEK